MTLRKGRPGAASGKGFTLLEVLVSVAIVGIAMMGLMQLMAKSVQSQAVNRDVTTAVVTAGNELTARLIDSEMVKRDVRDGNALPVDVQRKKFTEPDLERIDARVTWGPRVAQKTMTLRTFKDADVSEIKP